MRQKELHSGVARIFVVDDEPLLLDLIATALRLDGHQVTVMTDPANAVETMLLAPDSVDLLLTDADMRPLSGFQLVTQLRKGKAQFPVVFMSGHHGIGTLIADSLGQRAVLEKPFTAEILRNVVKRALSESKRTAQRVR